MYVEFARTAKVVVLSTKMPSDLARVCSNNFEDLQTPSRGRDA
jgi:hypothetical protein